MLGLAFMSIVELEYTVPFYRGEHQGAAEP